MKINTATLFKKYAKQEYYTQNNSVYKQTEYSQKIARPKQSVKYHIKKEIKFLYKKLEHLKQLLYQLHLQGAEYNKCSWQHALIKIDHTLNKVMENIIGSCKTKSTKLPTAHKWHIKNQRVQQSHEYTIRNYEPQTHKTHKTD